MILPKFMLIAATIELDEVSIFDDTIVLPSKGKRKVSSKKADI